MCLREEKKKENKDNKTQKMKNVLIEKKYNKKDKQIEN